jgi:hypothetical protein
MGIECDNTSPKTIEDYMRKSLHFHYGRTQSAYNTSFPGGALILVSAPKLV